MRYQYHSSRCWWQAHASAQSNWANYRVWQGRQGPARPRYLLVIFHPRDNQSTQRRLLEAGSCGRRALFGHIRVRRQQIDATVLPLNTFNTGLVQILTLFTSRTSLNSWQVCMGMQRVFQYGRRPKHRFLKQNLLACVQEFLLRRTLERGGQRCCSACGGSRCWGKTQRCPRCQRQTLYVGMQ
jgi:hypothetical protein